MKTLIIAFWSIDHATRIEKETFLMNKATLGLIEQGRTYIASFKEENFKEHRKLSEKTRVQFVCEFIFSQFLFTKCQVMIVVMNESLKDAFLKLIGYNKALYPKSDLPKTISGKAFKEDDKIFICIQDKTNLGFFPAKCFVKRDPETERVSLKFESQFNFN